MMNTNSEIKQTARRGMMGATQKKLRLFVWTGFSPDYTKGLAFAIAKNEAEARKLIEKKHDCPVYTWGNLTIYPLTQRVAECVSGGA